MTALTPKIKRRITEDWIAALPSLGLLRPMHLARRCGPLIIGVCLERDSSNATYRPCFHVHNLSLVSDCVSLTLKSTLKSVGTGAPETIPVRWHERHFFDAAGRLSKAAPLPFTGDVELRQVLDAYRAYLARPGYEYGPLLWEDMVSLATWAGYSDIAAETADEAVAAMAQWPDRVQMQIGGVKEWHAHVRESHLSTVLVRARAEEQKRTLKVDKLPVGRFIEA